MSVPNQFADDGGFNRRIGDTASGSTVPSHGANTATTIITTRMMPPTIAIGCRRNASRKRRHVGDTDLAPVAGAGITAAISRAGPPRDVDVSGAKPRPEEAGRERGREADARTPRTSKRRKEAATDPPPGGQRTLRAWGDVSGNYPPAKPGALDCEPLKA